MTQNFIRDEKCKILKHAYKRLNRLVFLSMIIIIIHWLGAMGKCSMDITQCHKFNIYCKHQVRVKVKLFHK